MYVINMNNKTICGTRLDTGYLPHEPENTNKIIRLRESMIKNGWTGRAVILIDAGDHHIALTGSHRLAAAQGLEDVEINAVILDDLTASEYDLIDSANDDDDLLYAFAEIIHGYRSGKSEIIKQCMDIMAEEAMRNIGKIGEKELKS